MVVCWASDTGGAPAGLARIDEGLPPGLSLPRSLRQKAVTNSHVEKIVALTVFTCRLADQGGGILPGRGYPFQAGAVTRDRSCSRLLDLRYYIYKALR
jgi:hypothetical protein